MTAAEQPGQLLFVGFDGLDVPDDLGSLVAQGRVGGVVLFARNIESPQQLRALADDLHARAPDDCPLTVAIDQEGGRVQRCRSPWTEWPPMRRLGERRGVADTEAVARALGRELADLRVDLDFAPCVDVDGGPEQAIIGDRSFSRDPHVVARHGAAFIAALEGAGVAACAKHFPGHGDTAIDSHVELPRLERDLERLRAVELVPFAAAARAGVASVMTAHIVLPALDPELPSTLCPAAIALLRDEIGFEGLVFGDDLEMKAVADHFSPEELTRGALGAGVDSLLVCRSRALRDGVLAVLETLPDAALEASLRRMARFKARYSGGRRASGAGPPYDDHVAFARQLGGGSAA
ncbi:MAG: beta-N-acetylhexosaminidase [Myxococcota bacterium]